MCLFNKNERKNNTSVYLIKLYECSIDWIHGSSLLNSPLVK